MDHFVDLGIETIHMTPNFKTSGMDMGYDITDFYEIEPKLGTMEDFDELISEMKKRGRYRYICTSLGTYLLYDTNDGNFKRFICFLN